MSHLQIFAGTRALQRLQEEGLNASQFRALLGASGGPKWFVLYGLDCYLFGEFFRDRSEPLHTLGSSAGAWRMCSITMAEPVAAIQRLAELYSQEDYSPEPNHTEITDKAWAMLQVVLGSSGNREIVTNTVFKTHTIEDRVKGPAPSHSRTLQALMLGSAAVANVVSRKCLSWFLQRTRFATLGADSPWSGLQDLDTQIVQLTTDNLGQAMMASGSIPFVLKGERDIPGARKGLYWDGGITDYHFDLPFHVGDGLVLYPHFSPRVAPGWFDKHLAWRKPHAENFSNVVLVTPSAEFVQRLPYGKIPDRKDFQNLDYQSRVRYWQQALEQSRYIADDFAQMVENGSGLDQIKPLPF